VAFQPDPFGDGVAPGVELAMRQAREALLAAGQQVEEVKLSDATEAAALWGRVTMAEVAALFQSDMDRHGSGPLRDTVRAYGEHFGPVGLEQVMRDLMARNRIRRAWSQLLERHDLVPLPVSAELAFPNELDFRQPDQIPRVLRAQRCAYLINLLGQPSVARPTGLLDGVPLGVQLVGAQLGTLTQQLWQQGMARP
jgi:amidase